MSTIVVVAEATGCATEPNGLYITGSTQIFILPAVLVYQGRLYTLDATERAGLVLRATKNTGQLVDPSGIVQSQ